MLETAPLDAVGDGRELALRAYRDRQLPACAPRVLDYFLRAGVLIVGEPRDVKIAAHSPASRVDGPSFMRAMNALVRRGYLLEFARGHRRVRRLAISPLAIANAAVKDCSSRPSRALRRANSAFASMRAARLERITQERSQDRV